MVPLWVNFPWIVIIFIRIYHCWIPVICSECHFCIMLKATYTSYFTQPEQSNKRWSILSLCFFIRVYFKYLVMWSVFVRKILS